MAEAASAASTTDIDKSGRRSEPPPSPLLLAAARCSRLETEIGEDNFGVAVRMACADASAPYKLPLQDQHMFPEPEAMLPVCLVQRYTSPPEEDGWAVTVKGSNTERDGDATAAPDEEKKTPSKTGPGTSPVPTARVTPPPSPVWVQGCRPSSSLPVSSTPPLSPGAKTASGYPSAHSPRSARAARVAAAAAAGAAAAAARHAESSFSDPPRPPSVETVTAAAAVVTAPPSGADWSPPNSSAPSSPAPVPTAPTRARSEQAHIGRRHRSRSMPPLARAGVATVRAGVRAAAAVTSGVRPVGKGKKSALVISSSPPPPPPMRTKSGRNLSPFFGNKGGVFLSPISKNKPRHRTALESSANVSHELTSKSSTRGMRRKGGGGTGGAGGKNSNGDENSEGRTVEANEALRESPIALPERVPSPNKELSQITAPPQLVGNKAPGTRKVHSSTPPPRTAEPPRLSPRLSPTGRSRSVSPGRPRPKPMAERERNSHDVGEPLPSRAGSSDNKSGAAPSLATGRDRTSLLDAVEQSSDLGAFFRQGVDQDSRRRGRMSPRRRHVAGGHHPSEGSGRRGDVSGFRENRQAHSRTDSRGKTRRRREENVEVDEGEDEEDDEEEEDEGMGQHGTGAGVHVVVLHHGYCGSSMDMRLIKNYIR